MCVASSLVTTFATAQNFERHGDDVYYRGNKFTMQRGGKDTIIITDPVSGEEKVAITNHLAQTSVNGEKIYTINEVTDPPQTYIIYLPLEEYLLSKLRDIIDISKLPDGRLYIGLDDIILDKKGKVIYYNATDVHFKGEDAVLRTLTSTFEALLLSVPPMKPAEYNGNKVICHTDISMADYIIEVKSHIFSYRRKNRMGR